MLKSKKSIWAIIVSTILGFFVVTEVWASYDFVFEVPDYAKEGLYYYPLYFHIDIENTGTEPDTIDLYLTSSLPSSWFADFCVRGKCVLNYAYIDL